jgi:hypothetical protein
MPGRSRSRSTDSRSSAEAAAPAPNTGGQEEEDEEHPYQCAVCQDHFTVDDIVSTTVCSHKVCDTCFAQLDSRACATCRAVWPEVAWTRLNLPVQPATRDTSGDLASNDQMTVEGEIDLSHETDRRSDVLYATEIHFMVHLQHAPINMVATLYMGREGAPVIYTPQIGIDLVEPDPSPVKLVNGGTGTINYALNYGRSNIAAATFQLYRTNIVTGRRSTSDPVAFTLRHTRSALRIGSDMVGVLEVLDETGARISGPHFDGNMMTLPDRVPEGDTDARSAFMSHLNDEYSAIQRAIDDRMGRRVRRRR